MAHHHRYPRRLNRNFSATTCRDPGCRESECTYRYEYPDGSDAPAGSAQPTPIAPASASAAATSSAVPRTSSLLGSKACAPTAPPQRAMAYSNSSSGSSSSSPHSLRNSSDGKWGALDQLNDKPAPGERIYLYQLIGNRAGFAMIDYYDKKGCATAITEYRFHPTQPPDADLRDGWIAWCEANQAAILASRSMEGTNESQ